MKGQRSLRMVRENPIFITAQLNKLTTTTLLKTNVTGNESEITYDSSDPGYFLSLGKIRRICIITRLMENK
jgi:hypothetical protein